MAGPLTAEKIVALRVLKEQGQSNRQIARILQVSEGAIRYHLRQLEQTDGRANKPRKADALAEPIDLWLRQQQGSDVPHDQPLRPANIKGLFEWLQSQHRYEGSYKSVL